MAKTKISKLAKDLNVSQQTIFEFLRKKDITVEENPNTRVEDNIVAMLNSEFNKDREVKTRSEREATERHTERARLNATPAREGDALTSRDSMQKPKILGKLELDAKGRPVVVNPAAPKPEAVKPEAPKAAETPKAEAPVKPEAPKPEAPVKPEAPKAAEPKKEAPKAEAPVKPEAPKAAEPKKEAPKPQATVKPEPKKEAPKAEAVKPEAPKAEPAVKAETPKADDNFIQTEIPKTPGLNIVGKIDLDALNQNTRPKKKGGRGRDERRGGGANGAAGAAGANNADKKKRKRIGGNRVDIEKAGEQAARNEGGRQRGSNNNGSGNNNGGNNERRHDKNQRGNKQPQPRQVVAEVSDEDVSKQVKETLARLTAKDKNLKKGAKWRKEKREANAEAMREAAAEARAESRVLKLTEFVTANDLALMMDVPINNVIATCMNIGVMVSINQRLDAETINIVAEEFGFKTEYVSAEVVDAITQEEDSEEDLEARPPIVTVMGHVDHGKTSLLDYIRNAI